MAMTLTVTGKEYLKAIAGATADYEAVITEAGDITEFTYAWSVVTDPADLATIAGTTAEGVLTLAEEVADCTATITCTASYLDESQAPQTVVGTLVVNIFELSLVVGETYQQLFHAEDIATHTVEATLTGLPAGATATYAWSIANTVDGLATITPDDPATSASLAFPTAATTKLAGKATVTCNVVLKIADVSIDCDISANLVMYIVKPVLMIQGDDIIFGANGGVLTYTSVLTGLDVIPAGLTLEYTWDMAVESATAELCQLEMNVPDSSKATFTVLKNGVGEATISLKCTYRYNGDSAQVVAEDFIVTLTPHAAPARFTGRWANAYIASCDAEVQARFAALKVYRAIAIPDTDDVLRSEQVNLVLDSI